MSDTLRRRPMLPTRTGTLRLKSGTPTPAGDRPATQDWRPPAARRGKASMPEQANTESNRRPPREGDVRGDVPPRRFGDERPPRTDERRPGRNADKRFRRDDNGHPPRADFRNRRDDTDRDPRRFDDDRRPARSDDTGVRRDRDTRPARPFRLPDERRREAEDGRPPRGGFRDRRDDAPDRAPRRFEDERPPRNDDGRPGRAADERFRRDDDRRPLRGDFRERPRREDTDRGPRRFADERPARSPQEARPPRSDAPRRPGREDERRPPRDRDDRPARGADARGRRDEARPFSGGNPDAPAPAGRPRPVARPDAPPRHERKPWNGEVRPAPTPSPLRIDGSIRLSKRMTELGLCSRREADEYIEKGWVRVDGRVVSELGARVKPGQTIELDRRGQTAQERRVTILLNKPVGYVSGQAEDGYEPASVLLTPENRWAEDPNETRWLRTHLKGLAPAGRLDIDSVGLLVFTQDGRIARALIGDDSDVEKEYHVRVEGRLPPEGLALLNHGLSLDGQALRPAKVSWLNEDQLRFVLREGKKRQIRRMCELVGLKVVGLKRVRIGRVLLGPLPPGQWRYLAAGEKF